MTLNLQGIKTETTEAKLEFYRKALSERLGEADLSAEKVNLMASLHPKHHEGCLMLGDFLQAQEQGRLLEELLADVETLQQAADRLNLIRSLLATIDDEKEFPGKQKARAALADLSLELKKLIRLNQV